MHEPMTILVVDDAEPVRTILVHALRLRGFNAIEAGGGPAALRAVLAAPPALAIIDQWMPEMTGAELIQLLRASPDLRVRELPVIGLSGRPGSEAELLRAGAQTFLSKPFGGTQLDAALRVTIGADRGALRAASAA
jgi:CheY-like chemotaxis protein